MNIIDSGARTERSRNKTFRGLVFFWKTKSREIGSIATTEVHFAANEKPIISPEII
ncbi:MAG: hypothetical protein HON90_00310 [Halobacteriovoraceae bacterium]|nr:hypothetical protein [Halobacteriovoraceae bacterium]